MPKRRDARDGAASPVDAVVLDRSSLQTVKELSARLRRDQAGGTEAIADATAKTLRAVVSSAKYWRLDELVHMIRTVGICLQEAQPSEPVIGNVTRRILFLLREEAKAATHLGAMPPSNAARLPPQHPSVVQSLAALALSPAAPSSPATSMHVATPTTSPPPAPSRSFSISDLVHSGAHATARAQLDAAVADRGASPLRHAVHAESLSDAASTEEEEEEEDRPPPQATSHAYQLKPLLIQAIQELIDELESVDSSIAKDAKDHIHSGEVILTLGDSATVRSFLRSAAKHRKFITIVPESAPGFSGHAMARALAAAGLSVLLVPDANLYALMPRVSKVILGARCVLANGGILAPVGAKAIAMAAREHSTPVVALAGVYKISPDWTWTNPERLAASNQGPPAEVVNYASSPVLAEHADIANPRWDLLIPGDLDVIITNVGEHPPSYVYRLIQENYHDEDLCL
ncbi:GCD complex subunit gcd7 [Malassezia sp. CBS 17886]|nr:GCD complex subunit gcd7 [Malassezia sp. CBS 17886]